MIYRLVILIALATFIKGIPIDEEITEKLDRTLKGCRNEVLNSFGIANPDEINYTEHELLMSAGLLCVGRKANFIQENGAFNIDEIKGALLRKSGPLLEKHEKILDNCIVQKDTPEKSMHDFFECLLKS